MDRSTFRCRIEPPSGGDFVWKTMVLDPNVELTDPSKPPFAAAPPNSRPYYGHPLLEETRIEGWCLGAVTDPFEPDCERGCTIGDAFVEAPDAAAPGWCGPWTRFRGLRCCASRTTAAGAYSTSQFCSPSRV